MLQLARQIPTIIAMEHRQVTVKDAAHELGISTRTVERRIQSGDLPSEAVNGRRYVLLPADNSPPPPTDDTDEDGFPNWLEPRTAAWFIADAHRTWNEATAGWTPEQLAEVQVHSDRTRDDPALPSSSTTQVSTDLRAERLQEVEADRDHWRHEAQQLQQRLAEVTTTLYRLTEQKALPQPDNRPDSPRRWWQIWKSPTRTSPR